MSRIKLYFLPHAGGSAMGYMCIKHFLDLDRIEPVPLELAGRGRRIAEPCFHEMEACVKDLFEQVKDDIEKSRYAFFGHSMGTLVTFELTHYIKEQGLRLPEHLFLSGRNAPSEKFPGILGFPDEEFLKYFRKLHGMPDEVVKNQELIKMILPILRTDVELTEKYNYREYEKLECGFSILYGKEDDLVTKEGMEKWKGFTKGECSFVPFDGKHFYYSNHRKEIAEIINQTLK